MCVTLAWLIAQTHNRTSSLYIVPLFWTRRVTTIYTASWTQCLWEWHDLWWRKRRAQSGCFSLFVVHIPKVCSEGKRLKLSENWQGDVSRDLHASAIYRRTLARQVGSNCRRRSPERWSSHIWTWGWQLRSAGLCYLSAYLSKAGRIKLQKKSCVMKQPDGHDNGSGDLQVLDMMMAVEICRSWTWWWQRRSAGLCYLSEYLCKRGKIRMLTEESWVMKQPDGQEDDKRGLLASAIYRRTLVRQAGSNCRRRSPEWWSSRCRWREHAATSVTLVSLCTILMCRQTHIQVTSIGNLSYKPKLCHLHHQIVQSEPKCKL